MYLIYYLPIYNTHNYLIHYFHIFDLNYIHLQMVLVLGLVLVLVLVLVLGPAVARHRTAMTTRDPALSIVLVASHAAYELRSDQPCPPISSPPWLPRCSFRWCGASRRRSLASTCWARWEAQVAMC